MRKLTVIFIVVGLFAAATIGFISGGLSSLYVALALIACGCAAIWFAPTLSQVERQMATSRWVRGDPRSRPFKVRIWGVGLIILGVGTLLDWYFSHRFS